MRVVVLGGSGMLGWVVLRELAADESLDVIASVRDETGAALARRVAPRAACRTLDAEDVTVDALSNVFDGASWAINAIGIIKPYIKEDEAASVERALRVNALFPHRLARAAERTGCRVLQIATDCVYSGTRGAYRESDAHDALDVYGKTKSLGEVQSPMVHHLRCSIIGPELQHHKSLLDWFLGQPLGATLQGFVNHQWNGVTTLHYARLCRAIVRHAPTLGHLQHVVAGDRLSKMGMLESFAREYGRTDLVIQPREAAVVVDRTLSTEHEDLNRQLWRFAGFAEPPTVSAMIAELAGSTRPVPAASAP